MLERTLGKLNHCGRKRAALTIDAAAGINDEKIHDEAPSAKFIRCRKV